MELKKANLHMDRVKCQINTQITLEEDKNISDRNPDAANILMEKGRVVIEDIRPGKDNLSMKGKLVYEVLYTADDEDGRLYRIQGEIPWEEKVRAEGMENIDSPQIQANIEDLSLYYYFPLLSFINGFSPGDSISEPLVSSRHQVFSNTLYVIWNHLHITC